MRIVQTGKHSRPDRDRGAFPTMFEQPTEPIPEPAQDAGLSADDYFRLIADERRRRIVSVLAEHGGPMYTDEIAEAVVAHGDDDGSGDFDPLEEATISLHHVHLPLMADAGVIDYDPETKRVDVHHLESLLQAV